MGTEIPCEQDGVLIMLRAPSGFGSDQDSQDGSQDDDEPLLEANEEDDPPVAEGYELQAYQPLPPPSESPEPPESPPDDEGHGRDSAQLVVQETWHAENFASSSHLAQWFPKIDTIETSDKGFRASLSSLKEFRIWSSLRSRMLILQIVLIAIILIANFVLTVVASTKYVVTDGAGLIYKGDCDKVKRLNWGLHVLINALSTAMLSASNFCMQLQAAPTRENVDKAHNKGKWLDIGVPSLRNLRHADKTNVIMWILLVMSSIPIHLFYNSAVFVSIASSNYGVTVVKDSFLTGSSWNITAAMIRANNDPGWTYGVNPPYINNTDVVTKIQSQASTYLHKDINACFQLYQDYWIPQGNVIVQVKNQSVQTPLDDSLLLYLYVVPRYDDWSKNMWAAENGTFRFFAQPYNLSLVDEWYLGPTSYEVSRCLVQDPSAIVLDCRLEYSSHVMILVCSMNGMKLLLMLWTWYARQVKLRVYRSGEDGRWSKFQAERDLHSVQVLDTLGDAIASFMRWPDAETQDMCLATRYDFESVRRPWYSWKKSTPSRITSPRRFDKKSLRWHHAVSKRSFIALVFINLLVLMTGGIILGQAIQGLRHRKFPIDWEFLTSLGFGRVSYFTFLDIRFPLQGTSALLLNVLLANSPQLIISLMYLQYNSIISTFMVQREFSKMFKKQSRKPLRVSQRIGIQRSTYFISLPLKYGVPLYAASAALHFLLSQSLFLARITAINPDNTVDNQSSFSTCEYSPTPIMAAMVIDFVLIVAVVGFSMKKFEGSMRMVSTNSAAISAACHCPEKDRKEGYLLPVVWGVISRTSDGVSKCAFTTAADPEVYEITEGEFYK